MGEQQQRPFTFYHPLSFRFADWVTHKLPLKAARGLARGLANTAYWVFPHLRRNVADNLSHVIAADRQRVRRLTQRTFVNYANQIVDYSRLSRRSNGDLRSLFSAVEGIDHLDAALKRGKGVIIVTAHLGNWELGGLLFAHMGYPLNAVTLEEHIEQLTDMREKYRSKRGIRTFRIGRSPFAFIDIMAALRRNEVIAMLVERPWPRAAVQVSFFGKPALFSSGPAVLAMTTDAVILPGFVWCENDGRYHGRLSEPLQLEKFDDRETSIQRNTQKIADVFESVIREHPDQWYNFVPIWGKD